MRHSFIGVLCHCPGPHFWRGLVPASRASQWELLRFVDDFAVQAVVRQCRSVLLLGQDVVPKGPFVFCAASVWVSLLKIGSYAPFIAYGRAPQLLGEILEQGTGTSRF